MRSNTSFGPNGTITTLNLVKKQKSSLDLEKQASTLIPDGK
jgi:hypothetical protein